MTWRGRLSECGQQPLHGLGSRPSLTAELDSLYPCHRGISTIPTRMGEVMGSSLVSQFFSRLALSSLLCPKLSVSLEICLAL